MTTLIYGIWNSYLLWIFGLQINSIHFLAMEPFIKASQYFCLSLLSPHVLTWDVLYANMALRWKEGPLLLSQNYKALSPQIHNYIEQLINSNLIVNTNRGITFNLLNLFLNIFWIKIIHTLHLSKSCMYNNELSINVFYLKI